MRAAVGRIQARSARPAGARRTVVVSMKPAKLGTDSRPRPTEPCGWNHSFLAWLRRPLPARRDVPKRALALPSAVSSVSAPEARDGVSDLRLVFEADEDSLFFFFLVERRPAPRPRPTTLHLSAR